jgi:hypothetical protein
MTKQNFGFFKGIAITAQHALPDTSPVLLRNDALQLSSISFPKRVKSKKDSTEVDLKTSLGAVWLKTRRRNPHGTLDTDRLIVSAHQGRPSPALRIASMATAAAQKHLEDESLASLFAGAQTGLLLMNTEMDEKLFLRDIEQINEIAPSLDKICETTGIAFDGVAELLTHEYVAYRLENTKAALHFVSGGFGTGGRYGWLDVLTDPTAADVYVDQRPMGTSPVVQVIATAGSHLVMAKQGKLKAEENATVPAVAKKIVNLKLA